MQVNITFRHLESTEAIKAHVREKVEHVRKYIDRPTEAHVVLHVENHLDHHAEITLKAGPFLLRGSAKTEDMYASIDEAVDKIEKQLKKHKEKLWRHKGAVTRIPIAEAPLEIVAAAEKQKGRVVRSNEMQAKPMSLDEAILQMDLAKTRFFVFQNNEDRAINVVYRRDDGNLGLIEARP